MFDRLMLHLRYATRLLVRSPLFTLTAVASLAIGIGANTTIFTAANALLFAPTQGVADPGRLIDIGSSRNGQGFDTTSFPAYEAVRDRSRLIDGVYGIGLEPQPVSLTRESGAVSIYAGVRTVAAGAIIPLEGTGLGLGALRKPGMTGDDAFIEADWNVVSPEFLAALDIPLLRGRHFTPLDRTGQPLVALVNERFAAVAWPGEDPIGKTIDNSEGGPRSTPRLLTVVGVARDSKYRWIGDLPRSFIYVPVAQNTWRHANFFVRRDAALPVSASVGPAIRQALRAFDPNLPLIRVTPLQEYADIGLLPQRLAASVAGSLGTVALLLGAIGIYGVTAFAVTRRTREIGVRMALGADGSAVMRMIIAQALRLTAIGGTIGLVLAAGATQLISDLLFGISAFDPIAFGSTIAILALVVVAASYLPARRAARIDPMIALRAE